MLTRDITTALKDAAQGTNLRDAARSILPADAELKSTFTFNYDDRTGTVENPHLFIVTIDELNKIFREQGVNQPISIFIVIPAGSPRKAASDTCVHTNLKYRVYIALAGGDQLGIQTLIDVLRYEVEPTDVDGYSFDFTGYTVTRNPFDSSLIIAGVEFLIGQQIRSTDLSF